MKKTVKEVVSSKEFKQLFDFPAYEPPKNKPVIFNVALTARELALISQGLHLLETEFDEMKLDGDYPIEVELKAVKALNKKIISC